MNQFTEFLAQNWPNILFALVACGVIGYTYYLTRRTRSEYMSRTALSAAEPKLNEAIIRHIVTAAAGLLVMLGIFSEGVGEELIGGVLMIVMLIASWNGIDKDTLMEKLTGIARHAITFLGGIGVIISEAQQEKWLGYASIIVTAIGFLWSLLSKNKKMKME